MKHIKPNSIKNILIILAFMLLCVVPYSVSQADTASAISFGTINYEYLTLQVFNNNNTVVYYSTDKTNWTEMEALYTTSTASYSMDISWVSATSDVTLYFKGNTVEKVKSITLPAQNTSFTVSYDKADGSFAFENAEEADYFEWRKTTDYYWHTVSMSESSSSYSAFLSTMEEFRVKGSKIIIRIAPVAGTGESNTGSRPSREQTIAIGVRGTAPTVTVNSAKMTLSTTTSMEYYDSNTDLWMECEASMSIEDIAPKALYTNGANTVTLQIRKAATTSAPYSKTTTVTVPGQPSAPTIGDNSSDVTHYILNGKLILVFNKASSTDIYQYCILDSDTDLKVSTQSWTSVTSTKTISISSSTAEEGDIVYIRKKGVDYNKTKKVDLVLSSAVSSFTVNY